MSNADLYSQAMMLPNDEVKTLLSELERQTYKAKTAMMESIQTYENAVHHERQVWKLFSARLEMEAKKTP